MPVTVFEEEFKIVLLVSAVSNLVPCSAMVPSAVSNLVPCSAIVPSAAVTLPVNELILPSIESKLTAIVEPTTSSHSSEPFALLCNFQLLAPLATIWYWVSVSLIAVPMNSDKPVIVLQS